MAKTHSTQALVIKRSNVGERDRIVTLLSAEHGKHVCIAKGVRSLTSTKRAYLEPGNVIKAFMIETVSLPLMTQATLVHDTAPIMHLLPKIRQLTQLLEVIDKLFVEEEIGAELFQTILRLRQHIISAEPTTTRISGQFDELFTRLGYPPLATSGYHSVLEYVSALTDSHMRSFEYLKVKLPT